MSSETLTPMMQQYQGIRRSLPPDTLLMYRLGDFFEMFFEDAKVAAGILNLALTKRGTTPMCGVPAQSAEGYIAKLVSAGKRVALCDQIGDPQPGKIVQREVTQIISPGTIADMNLLDARRNNYLAAVFAGGGRGKAARGEAAGPFGFAYADTSTGEFRLTELADWAAVEDELARVMPAEVLLSDDQRDAFPSLAAHPGAAVCEGYLFQPDHAGFTLREHFRVQSLDGFGCEGMPLATGAAGALLHYLKHQMRRASSNIQALSPYRNSAYLTMDAATQGNLELVQSRGGGRNTSLLHALDRTATPMGARLLRHWILHPLRELPPLLARQQAIADLLEDAYLLSKLREALKGIRDIERTLGRLTMASGNARDLQALKVSLEQLPDLRGHLEAVLARSGFGANAGGDIANDASASLLARLHEAIAEFPALVDELTRALVDEPPLLLREGGLFRDGFHAPLDELRAACREGKEWIARLQQREIDATGIKSLKIRHTSVFGYFIEVTKANLSSVPAHYHRKQTTVNGERFITPELKEMEGKILGADERSKALEYELFQALRERVLDDLAALQKTAAALARLDALAGLAETARLFGYCRPVLRDGKGNGGFQPPAGIGGILPPTRGQGEPHAPRRQDAADTPAAGSRRYADPADPADPKGLRILITDGRHPVLDQNQGEEKFVPNDVHLDGDIRRLHLITGPNMAGKSTYIRQVALIVLMAQIGSYVPAARAEIGLADRIFTRVGASDDLGRGQSTFMVEMNETANILNNATERSLVILDEIGRGTSTFDGLSIAWSVAEYLHDALGARTLFATHYHELTDLAVTRPGVQNYNVAVREWNDQIIFLRKIVPGGADKSYGIQVARLAGLPDAVLARAKEILGNLEQAELNAEGKPTIAQTPSRLPKAKKKAPPPESDRATPQMALF